MLDVGTRAVYIHDIDMHQQAIAERRMAKAKLFMTGGSQAVRLPAEFRFEGSEVDIRRDPCDRRGGTFKAQEIVERLFRLGAKVGPS